MGVPDIHHGWYGRLATAWGGVTGTLADQTDLQSALDAKAASSGLATVATSGAYADLSGAPTIPAYAYGQLTSNYTLTSQTAAQKLFNFSAGGALTLATGRYKFTALIHLQSMSATSGNGAFHLLGAGTATLADIFYHVSGMDNTSPLAAGTRTGSAAKTQNSPANMLTAGTGTGMVSQIDGYFNVTVTGTVIPSIALTTAAAAIVQAGSLFECIYMGPTGNNTQGTWS